MLSKKMAVIAALVVALLCVAEAREENPDSVAEALKMLEELDRFYMQAARPRIDRRDVTDGERLNPDLLDRAMRLLKLQTLDRLYSYHARPRFGKRSAYPNWERDVEKPDLPAWLAYARRR